ncbi:hypothetical protein GPAL_0817 [Glaciecola pallidula DSM 14239 = ACAM 615]|uniref:Uncharacterized protein n=1 Tax=Brumicola pallidula DSM 14239 = ACAM 615 TaxID=1121922 RepID=K6ZBF4_9ALTE|nr:hypothetical protein GPAL_0817 [Glaciecola pallidula DSM 14239 = ACAM 615]
MKGLVEIAAKIINVNLLFKRTSEDTDLTKIKFIAAYFVT